jgi:recombination protein RecA
VSKDIIQKAGSWYSYNGEQLAQGTKATAQVIEENNLYDEIFNKVLSDEEPSKEENKETPKKEK